MLRHNVEHWIVAASRVDEHAVAMLGKYGGIGGGGGARLKHTSASIRR